MGTAFVRTHTRQDLEREAHEDYLRAFPRGRPEPPKIVNVEPLLARERARSFDYRGHRYVVPPISFDDGAALQLFIQTDMNRWKDTPPTWDTLADYEATCARAAHWVWMLCRPAGWRRWIKRWMRNPFMRAGDNELGEIIGFFWQCRMKSSVRLYQATSTNDR